ncbi:hypothetical protein SELSPUOL_02687 [Selenomonas sputigena ATCC 35185]|uniref:Uncharacterized protein n=1 Tax=Selenomonas sputigena (strain ATCC 35185 / DSM 20758 / CCUG 44933 / VPI D19B-28) TaxID=546271 RepID=C9LYX6_SELS3|nr:hypothetical protein SELSPUOL_02687 [Selenomonas sputigena ATCC 35185]
MTQDDWLVAPHAGAWIEIGKTIGHRHCARVAPTWGVIRR